MRHAGCLLVLLLICPFARSEGRLFYSQSQRSSLEHARQHHVTEREALSPKPGDSPLTFDGVVIRSDGRDTQWLNGRPITGSTTLPAYRGRLLKPGQTAAFGRVYEPHQIIRGASQ